MRASPARICCLISVLIVCVAKVDWLLTQVDSIVKVAQKAMQPKALSEARAEHELVVAEASEARKAYLQQVLDSLQYLREHGLAGTAKQAVSTIVSRVDEAQRLPADRESEALPLVRNVQDAWSKLASSPPGTCKPS